MSDKHDLNRREYLSYLPALPAAGCRRSAGPELVWPVRISPITTSWSSWLISRATRWAGLAA